MVVKTKLAKIPILKLKIVRKKTCFRKTGMFFPAQQPNLVEEELIGKVAKDEFTKVVKILGLKRRTMVSFLFFNFDRYACIFTFSNQNSDHCNCV